MPKLVPFELSKPAVETEDQYVHDVYDSIASHFSQTRYKPWPLIATFLQSLETGSIGLDSGTGNGKYLPIDLEGKVLTVGLDRSIKLLEIAQKAGGKDREVVLGDAIGLGWRTGAFDFAISIATIHHLSTPDRRCQAVQALMRCLHPNRGRLLVYVWAIEQDELSKRVVPENSNAQENSSTEERPHESKAQDVLVPWVYTPPPTFAWSSRGSPDIVESKVYQRYYHMFAPSELHDLVCRAATDMGVVVGPRPTTPLPLPSRGLEIVNEGWEKSNYYLEARVWEITAS